MVESVCNIGVQTLAGKKPHMSHCQVSTLYHIRSDQRWHISFRALSTMSEARNCGTDQHSGFFFLGGGGNKS